jgi:hypothetical protein
MKHLLVAVTAALALAALPALASEATFERTLSVNGKVELSVSTGSGNIHLTQGSGNQVHIFGRVKSGWGGSDERVREIAAHPPIEQTGNIVRIGGHHENLHNISIDYEIEAPAEPISRPARAPATSPTTASAKTPSSPPARAKSTPPACTEASRRAPAPATSMPSRRRGRREGRDRLGQHRIAQPARRSARRHRLGQHQSGRNAGFPVAS